MHAHRIEILDGTNHHTVVHSVAHYLHLELFPANQRFFDQHFANRREIEPPCNDNVEFFPVIGNAATRPAESKCRPNNKRKGSDFIGNAIYIRRRTSDPGARHLEPDAQHRLFEQLPIFAFCDRLCVCANQFHAVPRQRAVAIQFHRRIERGLPAQRW